MKIVQALYGKKSGNRITGTNINPILVITGQKFHYPIDPYPGKTKVLFVLVETDDAERHKFIFKASEIIEFDFSTNNCPTCKGTGKQTCSITEIKDGKRIESSFEANCISCNGKPVSKLQGLYIQKQKEKEEKMWCRCEKETDSYYVPDTSKMKHHWKCQCCKKITQIG